MISILQFKYILLFQNASQRMVLSLYSPSPMMIDPKFTQDRRCHSDVLSHWGWGLSERLPRPYIPDHISRPRPRLGASHITHNHTYVHLHSNNHGYILMHLFSLLHATQQRAARKSNGHIVQCLTGKAFHINTKCWILSISWHLSRADAAHPPSAARDRSEHPWKVCCRVIERASWDHSC